MVNLMIQQFFRVAKRFPNKVPSIEDFSLSPNSLPMVLRDFIKKNEKPTDTHLASLLNVMKITIFKVHKG